MDSRTLTIMLQPFLAIPLTDRQIAQLTAYLDLLLKWNSKMNLTAIRQPEEIVIRHFGESLFVAGLLTEALVKDATLLDLGSGAGFPGLPIKIFLSDLPTVLTESQQKKAMFLREVIRSLSLERIDVYAGRAEGLDRQFGIVTMRAVDNQESLLTLAARLTLPGGSLLLMAGVAGLDSAKAALPDFVWRQPLLIPSSTNRFVVVGEKPLPDK